MPQPIDTAPRDGRKVQVQWRDRDGVESTSIARYMASDDPAEAGWWVHVSSNTKKRVEPHSWFELDADADE